jgi:hypothetical protein
VSLLQHQWYQTVALAHCVQVSLVNAWGGHCDSWSDLCAKLIPAGLRLPEPEPDGVSLEASAAMLGLE